MKLNKISIQLASNLKLKLNRVVSLVFFSILLTISVFVLKAINPPSTFACHWVPGDTSGYGSYEECVRATATELRDAVFGQEGCIPCNYCGGFCADPAGGGCSSQAQARCGGVPGSVCVKGPDGSGCEGEDVYVSPNSSGYCTSAGCGQQYQSIANLVNDADLDGIDDNKDPCLNNIYNDCSDPRIFETSGCSSNSDCGLGGSCISGSCYVPGSVNGVTTANVLNAVTTAQNAGIGDSGECALGDADLIRACLTGSTVYWSGICNGKTEEECMALCEADPSCSIQTCHGDRQMSGDRQGEFLGCGGAGGTGGCGQVDMMGPSGELLGFVIDTTGCSGSEVTNPPPSGGGGETPPPTSPPSSPNPSPSPGPQCLSISMTNVTNPTAPATQDPELGDAVTFTCGEVAGVDHYIFRIMTPDGNFQDLAATGRTSETYTITQSGMHYAQCQICTGADASTCHSYEAINYTPASPSPTPSASVSPSPSPSIAPSPSPSASPTVVSGTVIQGSCNSAGYPITNAFDGDTNTLGQCVSVANSTYVGFDLGSGNEATITQARIYRGSVGTHQFRGKLQYSDDNSTWTDTNQTSITITAGTNQWQEYDVNDYGAHRYWRFLDIGGDAYFQAQEIELIGY